MSACLYCRLCKSARAELFAAVNVWPVLWSYKQPLAALHRHQLAERSERLQLVMEALACKDFLKATP